jgi:hypothetical protein
MKNWQFDQYLRSYHERDRFIAEIDAEIAELYEDISPVLTGYYIDSIKKCSVSIETYVFHIIERKAELNFKRDRIEQQHKTVVKMFNHLNECDKDIINRSYILSYRERKYFKTLLEQFVKEETKASYTEDMTVYEHDLLALPVEEYDNVIESMDDTELFSDYYDQDDTLDIKIDERNRRMNEMRNARGRKSKQPEIVAAG